MSSKELSPLLRSGGNPIISSVNAVSEQKNLIDTCCQKTSRIGSNILAGLFSASGQIFYIPICLELGTRIGGNGGTTIGIISSICNSKAFIILGMWAATGIIYDILGPKTKEETALQRKNIGKCVIITTIISALVIAALSQVPYAIPAANYAAKKYKVIAGVTSLFGGILIPTRSIQLSINGGIKRISNSKSDSNILKLQETMIGLISEKRSNFINMPKGEQLDFITDLSGIQRSLSADIKTSNYFQKIFGIRQTIPSDPKWKKYWSIFGKVLGAGFTCIFEYAVAEYTFFKTKEFIWNNNIGAGFFSALVAGSTLYLFGQAIVLTTERVFNSVADFVLCKNTYTLGERLRPKLNFALKIEEAATNFFALAPTLIVWGDFYQDSTWRKYFFTSSISITLYIILLTSSLVVADGLTQTAFKDPNASGNKLIKMDSDFQRLISIVQNASPQDFIQFLQNLPNDIVTEITSLSGLSQEQLDQCLGQKTLEIS